MGKILEKKTAKYRKNDAISANVDILAANIEGLEIMDTEEQLFMGNGLLGEDSYLLGEPDHPQDSLVGLEVAGDAPKGAPIKLS